MRPKVYQYQRYSEQESCSEGRKGLWLWIIALSYLFNSVDILFSRMKVYRKKAPNEVKKSSTMKIGCKGQIVFLRMM